MENTNSETPEHFQKGAVPEGILNTPTEPHPTLGRIVQYRPDMTQLRPGVPVIWPAIITYATDYGVIDLTAFPPAHHHMGEVVAVEGVPKDLGRAVDEQALDTWRWPEHV